MCSPPGRREKTGVEPARHRHPRLLTLLLSVTLLLKRFPDSIRCYAMPCHATNNPPSLPPPVPLQPLHRFSSASCRILLHNALQCLLVSDEARWARELSCLMAIWWTLLLQSHLKPNIEHLVHLFSTFDYLVALKERVWTTSFASLLLLQNYWKLILPCIRKMPKIRHKEQWSLTTLHVYPCLL